MYISSHLIAHHMMRGLIAATLVVMAFRAFNARRDNPV